MASLVGKVRSSIGYEMEFAEFFLSKHLFLENATRIVFDKRINEEVSSF